MLIVFLFILLFEKTDSQLLAKQKKTDAGSASSFFHICYSRNKSVNFFPYERVIE